MNRSALATLILGTSLLGACAVPGAVPEDGPLIERVRQDMRLEPMLESSRVTVAERDEVIVFGGSVDSLEDLNIIRDIVAEIEAEGAVENNVVVQGGASDGVQPGS